MDQGNAFTIKKTANAWTRGGYCVLVSHLNKPKSPEEAMRHSIAKWEFLAAQNQYTDDGGILTCGLCRFHMKRGRMFCGKCPVAEDGYIGCEGTPYFGYGAYGYSNIKEAARREVAFLKRIAKKYHIQWD